MKRSLWAVVAVAVAVGTGLVPAAAGAQQPDQGSPDSEIGVTADTIRIAVIADVDNPARPGLFQGVVNGVEAFGKYINGTKGKLAGRNVAGRLHRLEAERRRGPQRRHQGVPGGLRDRRDERAVPQQRRSRWRQCVDKAGQATGLPDIPILQTEVAHQCSPISFPVIAPRARLRDEGPEAADVPGPGRPDQLLQDEQNKDLHGVWVIPSDLQSTINVDTAGRHGRAEGGRQGRRGPDRSRRSRPRAITRPIAQSIKDKNSTYAESISDYKSSVQLRKEAKVQGVNSVEGLGLRPPVLRRQVPQRGRRRRRGPVLVAVLRPLRGGEAEQGRQRVPEERRWPVQGRRLRRAGVGGGSVLP